MNKNAVQAAMQAGACQIRNADLRGVEAIRHVPLPHFYSSFGSSLIITSLV